MENVAPIQFGIRLLIPEGSRLLDLDEVRSAIVGPFDPQSLSSIPGNTPTRASMRSAKRVQAIAAEGDRHKESRTAAFERIWEAAHAAAGLDAPNIQTRRRPRLPCRS